MGAEAPRRAGSLLGKRSKLNANKTTDRISATRHPTSDHFSNWIAPLLRPPAPLPALPHLLEVTALPFVVPPELVPERVPRVFGEFGPLDDARSHTLSIRRMGLERFDENYA
jgi:hypothetical protein